MAPEKKYLYDRVTEAKTVRFVDQWMSVLGALDRYPATNRAVAQGVSRLYEMLPDILGDRQTVEFSELHNMLLINGVALSLDAQNKDSVGAFLFILLEHNVRRFTIQAGVQANEFMTLLDYLVHPPEEGYIAIGSLFKRKGIKHIGVEEHVATDRMATDHDLAETDAAAAAPAAGGGVREVHEELMEDLVGEARKLDPRHTRTEIRPPNTFRVVVVVRVGTLALNGAVVKGFAPMDQIRRTKSETGAALFLPAGENEIAVSYENYQVTRKIEVVEENQRLEIDLQKIFEY